MIKNFGFKNFSSFKHGAHIDFEFDGNTPANISNGNIIGIKGANGSGKTTILKALTFLFCFVSKRMNTRKNKNGEELIELPIEPFYDSNEVIEFYVELELNDINYYYELELLKSGIVKELLCKITNTKQDILIKREKNQIVENNHIYDELKKIKLKEDQSFISLTADYNFNETMTDINEIYGFFKKIISNVGGKGIVIKPTETNLISDRALFYNQNNEAFSFVKEIIKSCDDAIEDIIIRASKDENDKDIFYPLFLHRIDDKMFTLSFFQESMGTQTLFNELFKYWYALKIGATMVYDEFDTHLHAHILPEILNLFKIKNINRHNAQLIVTAHNTEIIDYFNRYGAILVDKKNNISFCYRLDEVSNLRNDRLISPYYKKGVIGGVPNNISGLANRISNEGSLYEQKIF